MAHGASSSACRSRYLSGSRTSNTSSGICCDAALWQSRNQLSVFAMIDLHPLATRDCLPDNSVSLRRALHRYIAVFADSGGMAPLSAPFGKVMEADTLTRMTAA